MLQFIVTNDGNGIVSGIVFICLLMLFFCFFMQKKKLLALDDVGVGMVVKLLVLELDLVDNLPVVIAHKIRRRDRHVELGLDILVLHYFVILALRYRTK